MLMPSRRSMVMKNNSKIWSILFALLVTLWFSGCSQEDNKVIVHTTVEGADFYVDKVRVRQFAGDKVLLQLASGKHLIEIKKSVSPEWDLYGKKQITVVDGQTMIGINVKRVPTTSRIERIKTYAEHVKTLFIREGDVVKDKQTGFIWQDNNDTQKRIFTHTQAQTYCDNLTLDNISQWELPSREELLTLVEYDRYSPAIVYTFKHFFKGHYWTSDKSAKREKQFWYVDFNFGDTDYRKQTQLSSVRCIYKGNAKPKQIQALYRDNTLEVVRDPNTSLMWQDSEDMSSMKFSQKGAQNYCQNLSLATFSDWRLPTIKELLSITDTNRFDPALKEVFKVHANTFYWTSSDFPKSVADVWYVNLSLIHI